MPRGKGGGHRDGAVVLTPARGTSGSASPKGQGRDLAPEGAQVTPNSKGRRVEQDRSPEKQPKSKGRGGSWGFDKSKGNSTWGHDENKDANNWGRGEGKAKGVSKGTSEVSTETKLAGQPPRVRDEIQEEVDEIISKNSNLAKTDFDGRVFQYLHAIHGVGGQEKVRQALETIHKSTLQKQRSSIKKWPAYLATLLRKSFENLGAEKKEERENAEAYGKQLTLSVEALFEKPVEMGASGIPGGPDDVTPKASGNAAANPQEADEKRTFPQEWLKQAVTEEREHQWLKRGNNLLLSPFISEPTAVPVMPESPLAIRCVPPGFTPPQTASPAHGSMLVSVPQAQVSSFPPAYPPSPPPRLPSQPPPPPPTSFQAPDPYKWQLPTKPPPPPPKAPTQLPINQISYQSQELPRVISPPAAPTNNYQQQRHEPRVVPPPRRQQQSQMNTSSASTVPKPPPPPTEPPTHAPASPLLPEASWTTKSTPLLPPPWPAQYVDAA